MLLAVSFVLAKVGEAKLSWWRQIMHVYILVPCSMISEDRDIQIFGNIRNKLFVISSIGINISVLS